MAARANSAIESPTGLDLQPSPPKPARISKRASAVLIVVVAAVLSTLAYGGWKRAQGQTAAAAAAGSPSGVIPATSAADEFLNNGNAPTSTVQPSHAPALHPVVPTDSAPLPSGCSIDPRTNQPYRFNSETGQACGSGYTIPPPQLPPAPSTVPNFGGSSQGVGIAQQPPLTPEQQAVLVAYKREQDAMLAPTSIRSANSGQQTNADTASGAVNPLGSELALLRALSGAPRPAELSPALLGLTSQPGADDQSRKEAFFAKSHENHGKDYLGSTREPSFSPYEIKAGWEIPAVLEQELNSDLPGQLKALVKSNVYDTATGRYLLVPQGARLIGKYDSHVSYGQNGVQVAWSRIIYPDASSVDLDGMEGLDAHGNAGLREKVDRHYKRLIGMTALSSIFSAGFGLSQYRQQSVLSYPSPGEMASSALSEDLANSANQLTRKNVSVQPNIKIPVGYEFTVRVDRDIAFDAPYAANQRQEIKTVSSGGSAAEAGGAQGSR